jgi:hypothetical protein
MARTTENIGLLFVHGIGEQKKLEHLTACAREFAALVAESDGLIRLDVRDECEKAGRFTIDAVYARRPRIGPPDRVRIQLHLHEVWWADLGASGGLGEQIRFWLWSLGQWAAQVVREGDPRRNTMKLMDMPSFDAAAAAAAPPANDAEKEAAAKKAAEEPGLLSRVPARLLLFAAGILAFLTLFSWSAAKRVVAFLAQRLPSPSLIFLFLGDVKTYEEAGRHGKGSMVDPDQPMRTTIRRRMVSAMTRMANRPDYDRWYIFAHSLGTVPAFNALQETEWALPNYLTEEEWEKLPDRFKTETPFTPPGLDEPPGLDHMMPRRPPWLKGEIGIDRKQLFARFAGLVTYGSPLDKFAALWPRVVCLNRQVAVFPKGCEWVNLYEPTDPVCASLGAFAGPARRADPPTSEWTGLIPHNVPARAGLLFGLSHILYFEPPSAGLSFDKLKRIFGRRAGDPTATPPSPASAALRSMPAAIVEAIVSGRRMSLAEAADKAAMPPSEVAARIVLAVVQLLILALALALASALLLYLIGKALPDSVAGPLGYWIGALSPTLLAWLRGGLVTAIAACGAVMLAAAFLAVSLSGAARMVVDLLRPPHG